MLVQTYQESPKQPSSPEKIDTQATPADDKEVGGVVGLNYFSPLKSMDFKELFSPLSIQKSASCFSSWVDFESEANKQREAAELELEWSMIPGQEREGKKEGDEDEMTMMTTQGDITIARAVGAAEGEKEGDRTKGLDALAKELVADFFSDDIFAISGTNYDNEDAFADLLRDGTTKQKKKAGELLFINNREEEDEGDDDEFEDLEGPEKEADEDVQEKERVRELDDDMARMDRQIKEMDNSDFLDFMGDERGEREAEAEAEELDSSVQDLRRDMKKEAQRRISKCFDFDLEINWDGKFNVYSSLSLLLLTMSSLLLLKRTNRRNPPRWNNWRKMYSRNSMPWINSIRIWIATLLTSPMLWIARRQKKTLMTCPMMRDTARCLATISAVCLSKPLLSLNSSWKRDDAWGLLWPLRIR